MSKTMEQLIYVNVVGFPDGNLEPVKAIYQHGSCFRIVGVNDDDEHFPWEFITGEIVTCEKVSFYEDESGLVAKQKCRCTNV
ncbi:hypothetical protein FE810_05315 [Thalassotalea litorea]|uniref:Uncharacterized protein n=1 Tax=Thalassotalea litorea TaxID=2020715 RepID=A0A5R9IUS7_9GAMM|nr:hypothetical protein [Thalassotalea litorea]TLU66926.1 hypothetical protein FE810_05315 [Thalassotalea litorea]